MKRFVLILTTLTFAIGMVQSASAEPRYIKTVEAEFEDIWFDLKDAIINAGLVIEHVGHVGKMLERTAEVVSDPDNKSQPTYSQAKYLQFCSSKLTHQATGADPRNLSVCPFIIYAFEARQSPGKVSVGYRNPDFGDLDNTAPLKVETHQFLKKLVDSTIADYQ